MQIMIKAPSLYRLAVLNCRNMDMSLFYASDDFCCRGKYLIKILRYIICNIPEIFGFGHEGEELA